jgi:putative peptidoglycan lipid II flippase
MLIKVLAPGYYARKDMRTPVRIGIRAMVANMVLNLLFVGVLVSTVGYGHVGLALATSASAALNAGLLWRGLHRDGVYRFSPGWRALSLRVVPACAVMLSAILLLCPDREAWFALAAIERALAITGLCALGVALYVTALWLAGLRPADLRAPDHTRHDD